MADFIDIPIDVTAKQIEDKVNEKIDMVVRKGSLNPVMSGAVANALEIIKISADHLLPKSVTSEKIAPKAVSGDKIADEAIDYYHIKDGAIAPTQLDREYVVSGSPSALVISADSIFHNFILANSSPDRVSPYTKICLFAVGTKSGILFDAGVSGRCVGYYLSATQFVFTALSSLTTYIAVFDETELKSIDNITDDVIDTAIDNKLAIIKLGILNTYDQIKTQSLATGKVYLFYTGAVIASQIGDSVFLGVYVKNDYNNYGENHIIKCVDLASGVRWIIDIDNETSTVDTSYLNIDQTYNPNSENAQSGTAVRQAVVQLAQELKQESEGFTSIRTVELNDITYDELWKELRTYGAIFFDTSPVGWDGNKEFTGAQTDLNLPIGSYVAFVYQGGNALCWNLKEGIGYRLVYRDYGDGDVVIKVYSPVVDLQNSVGDIDTALDNINKELNGLETLLASI